MKCFSSAAIVLLLLALLTITNGMAATDYCYDLRVNNNCEQMAVSTVEYELNAYCIDNTTVHISYRPPPSDLGYTIEMITMQYTCYVGNESYAVAVAHNSEVLEESYERTDQLFSIADYCVFTGCTKPERMQCWQFISSSVNITNCASGSHQPKVITDQSSTSLQQSPSVPSILATPSSGVAPYISSSPWLTAVSHSTPIVSVESSSLPTLIPMVSHEGGGSSQLVVASVQLTDQSGTVATSSPPQLMPIFFAIAAGLLLITLLAALLVVVVMCKRFSKRVSSSEHSTSDAIEAIHETSNNIYMDDSNMFNILHFEPITGSVLTLVQPLHLDDMINDYNNQPHPPARPSSLYTSASNVASSSRSTDVAVADGKTLFSHSHTKPDSCKCASNGDIFHLTPVLNNSCPSIPDKLIHSPHGNAPLSSDALPSTRPPEAFTVPTDDTVSCDSIHMDQQTECQLNDAVFSDGVETSSVAPCLPRKPALHACKSGGPLSVSSSASHCSTSSSGYISTSPAIVNGLQQEFCFNRDYIVDYRTSA